MSQPIANSQKLWSKPKVLMSPTDLIIEGRYYPLDQIQGAYSELVPAPQELIEPLPPPKPRKGFSKVLFIIGIVIIAAFASILGGDAFFGSVGGAKIAPKEYKLILIRANDPTAVLVHSNQQKIEEITSQINQALISRGISPQTAIY